jgi:LPXTG-motif cell wall-anchored protein
LQGTSVTPVNTSYKTAPRVYRGNYLYFEAPDGVTFDSIVLTYTETYSGASVTYGASTSTGIAPVGGTTAAPTNGTAITDNTSTKTLTTGNLNSAKSAFIMNGYTYFDTKTSKWLGSTNTQIRPTVITINYTSTITMVNPTAVSVSLANSTLTSLGATTQASVTFTPANTTDKTVTWSTSNSDVAVVDATGLVTAIGAGTASITAKSNAVSTVTGSATITVNPQASSVYDKVHTVEHYAVNHGGYPTSGYYANLDDVLYYSEAMGVMSGVIQGQKTNGLLYNKSGFASTIKDVIITLHAAGTAPCSIAFGATANAKTDVATAAVSGAVNTFTPSGSYSYFTIYSLTETLQIDSIVVELVNTDVEAARTWATNFLAATNVCDSTGAADNITSAIWTAQSNAYTALSATAQAALTANANYNVATNGIGQAVQRYKYIVNKYGAAAHANFLDITVTPSSQVGVSKTIETSDATLYTIAAIALLAAGAFFLFRKKKQA